KDHLTEDEPRGKQDYTVQIEGPLVEQIQAFCRTNLSTPQPERQLWLRRWQRLRRRWPAASEYGTDAVAAFVTRDNLHHTTDIERHYRAAIRSARSHIVIANAYF